VASRFARCTTLVPRHAVTRLLRRLIQEHGIGMPRAFALTHTSEQLLATIATTSQLVNPVEAECQTSHVFHASPKHHYKLFECQQGAMTVPISARRTCIALAWSATAGECKLWSWLASNVGQPHVTLATCVKVSTNFGAAGV
jgi:hypothetical protein